MRTLLFMMLLAVSSMSMAQQEEVIWDICGAKFGDSFEATQAAINKYMEDIKASMGPLAGALPGTDCPKPMVFNGRISYMRWGSSSKYFTFYDVVFDELYFSFTSGDAPHFRYAAYIIKCKSKREAKEKFKEVVETLRKRFTLYQLTDQDGNDVYGGGTYYKNEDNFAFLVSIEGDDKDMVFLSFREGGF